MDSTRAPAHSFPVGVEAPVQLLGLVQVQVQVLVLGLGLVMRWWLFKRPVLPFLSPLPFKFLPHSLRLLLLVLFGRGSSLPSLSPVSYARHQPTVLQVAVVVGSGPRLSSLNCAGFVRCAL